MRIRFFLGCTALVIGLCVHAGARAENAVILQYFEAEWDTMQYRMPDVFMAGYDGVWLPPPQRAAAGTSGIGYDLFDRFDLGTDADPTRYGSESGFRLMVEQYHKADCRVFVDWLMNHNASWDKLSSGDPFLNNGQNFWANGGYPGFTLDITGVDADGDFHSFSGGCPQSHDPGGGCYDLFNGRLLGLIDIDPFKDHQYIRHPVTTDPNNIPVPGTSVRNQPDADNARFYPDLALGGFTPSNPGTNGRWPATPSPPSLTFYPYNTADPMAGDAVLESATGLLMRSSQWYLDVLKVDGFRLDAAKHMEPEFWDNYWDAAVNNRYVAFDGSVGNPYSFVEAVESPANILNWVRKPNDDGSSGWPTSPSGTWSFGNRDALEINEAGDLRNIVGNPGSVTWSQIMFNNVDDQDDGLNNGSVGVHHVTSHDNSFGWGNNIDDIMAQAYVLMRTGSCVVYHNALQFGTGVTFPERDSRQDALGLGSTAMTTLVKLRNQYARGWFVPRVYDASILVFTRQTPNDEDNVLIALNDQLTTSFQSVFNLQTAFATGTRLHELTGNSGGSISELLVVDGSQRIPELRIPGSGTTTDGGGYVIYGPAVPSGTLSIANATVTVAPPDLAGTDDYIQRVSEVQIITSSTFDILLQTTQTDASDPNTDDRAVFRIDNGFVDSNGNGGVDHLDATSPDYGFEDFLDANSPLWGGGTGTYRQTINAATLGEGYHYITVQAYRHRPAGASPLFGEFRLVIYVDLANPDFTLLAPTATCNNDITSMPVDFVVQASDTTVDRVHVLIDFPEETDFIALAQSGSGQADRFMDVFTLSKGSMLSGNHRVDIVAFETLPNGTTQAQHKTFTGVQSTTGSGLGPGDVNHNGVRDTNDIFPFIFFLLNPNFDPAADMNCDGLLDGRDTQLFVDTLVAGP